MGGFGPPLPADTFFNLGGDRVFAAGNRPQLDPQAQIGNVNITQFVGNAFANTLGAGATATVNQSTGQTNFRVGENILPLFFTGQTGQQTPTAGGIRPTDALALWDGRQGSFLAQGEGGIVRAAPTIFDPAQFAQALPPNLRAIQTQTGAYQIVNTTDPTTFFFTRPTSTARAAVGAAPGAPPALGLLLDATGAPRVRLTGDAEQELVPALVDPAEFRQLVNTLIGGQADVNIPSPDDSDVEVTVPGGQIFTLLPDPIVRTDDPRPPGIYPAVGGRSATAVYGNRTSQTVTLRQTQ